MRLIHPNLLHKSDLFFQETLFIQRRIDPPPRNALGERIDSWENILELDAAKSPIEFFTGAVEREQNRFTSSESTHHILIPGYYPEISTTNRAVIDNVVYDIDLVETDQTKSVTRLWTRIVEV